MKILLIGSFSGEMCGELLANQTLLKHLRRTNHSVKVVSTVTSRTISAPGGFKFSKLIYALVAIMATAPKVVWSDRVYVTPGYTLFGIVRFFPIFALAKIFGKRITAHHHGSGLISTNVESKVWFRWVIKKWCAFAHNNIFLTDSMRRKYCEIAHFNNPVVINNFVESTFENSINDNKEFDTGSKSLTMLFLSNLFPEKGFMESILACDELNKRGVNCELIVAGNASEKELAQVRRIVSNLEFGSRIDVVGPVFGRRKLELFLSSDLFLLPTSYSQEGLPISILEALATRCIVLACGIGGIPEVIVHGENGVLLSNSRTETIVAAILELVSDEDLFATLKRNVESKKYHQSEEMFAESILKVIES